METEAVIADKGYDSEAKPCIPPRKNRTEPIKYDRHLYCEPNALELFFGRIKQYRRVATRYNKKATNVLGFV